MANQIERAEAGTRVRITNEDRQYKGIARHPLARRWMMKRLVEAREKAVASESDSAFERWSLEADRVSGEMKRYGISVGGIE